MPAEPIRLAAVLALVAALGGCDKPRFSDAPRVKQTFGVVTTTEPLPPLPAWAAPLLGKGMRDAFPAVADCVGSADAVDLRYEGAAAGSRVTGWAWDRERKAPPPRIVLTDKRFRIVGAGETGLARPDVMAARDEVTTPAAGWHAVTARVEGQVYAFGADESGRACKLGRIGL